MDNSSGNYKKLSSMQFKVFVNDLESSIFNITNLDLTNINLLKLESSLRDTGTSWINAIGYKQFVETVPDETPVFLGICKYSYMFRTF